MNIQALFLDLDGTLIRKHTSCQLIAEDVGMSSRMAELERTHSPETIVAARNEVVLWYRELSIIELLASLDNARIGSGVDDLCAYCRERGIPFAIVSMTWSFVVEYFAKRFGAVEFLGTDILPGKCVLNHVFPETKADFVRQFLEKRRLNPEHCCAIGDSWGDFPMLESVGIGLVIGKKRRKDLPKNCIEIDGRRNLLTEFLRYTNSVRKGDGGSRKNGTKRGQS